MKIETIWQLIAILIQIESGGNDLAVGDNGKALGCLQIHEIYVRDINRLWGTDYKHIDAFERTKATQMFLAYTGWYAVKMEEDTGRKATFEDIARIHNGGPDGWKKESTKAYWDKVKLYAGSPVNPASN